MKPNQLSLFDEFVIEGPPTEGVKYAGSKLRLIPHILELAKKTPASSVLDGFAGTTRVSQAFARVGYRVVCNDSAIWSKFFGTCYLLGAKGERDYRSLIDHLNALPPKDGWFSEHYGGESSPKNQSEGSKRPWQLHNTRKADAIRDEIEALQLNDVDKAVALTSLILALDQVDSTVGHFASYLRDWAPRSFKSLRLRIPHIVETDRDHEVLNGDIFDAIPKSNAELAYYDPPYGSNNEKMPPSRVRYSAYYHVWTTVCLHDKPTLFGKVNRRADTSDSVSPSVFEDFRRCATGGFVAVKAIEKLLMQSRAQWIILSYSSGGRATACELDEAIRAAGRLVEVVEVDYKRNVMSGMRWTNEWIREAEQPNREYVFLIEHR